MKARQMPDNELGRMMDNARRHAGIDDVMKLHQDYLDRVHKNDIVLRTRHYNKGTLVTSNSTY